MAGKKRRAARTASPSAEEYRRSLADRLKWHLREVSAPHREVVSADDSVRIVPRRSSAPRPGLLDSLVADDEDLDD